MPLTLILGPANSAKAGVVLDAYKAASRRDALLVVPTAADAAHYDRELTAEATVLGRALTFPHLTREIARRARYERTQLTALQRERVLARALAAAPLTAFAQSAAAPGFAAAAARLFAELRGAHVEAPRFAAALALWAAERSEATQQYAHDLAALYLRYSRAVDATGLVDEQQYAWGALDLLRRDPSQWGTTPVYFYGFDDLSAVQLDAVETLSAHVGVEVTVSLTYEQDHAALWGRARVVGDLRQLATTVIELDAVDAYYEPGSRVALHHLERMLFEPDAPRVAAGDAVQLIEAGGALAEAEQVAAEVLAALRDGVRAEEIVVVARSLNRSGAVLERTLSRYGIPVSSTRRVPVTHTRLGSTLSTLAELALREDRDQLPAARLIAYLRGWLRATTELDAVDEFEAALRRGGVATVGRALAHGAAATLKRKIDSAPLALLAGLRAAEDPASVLTAATAKLLAASGPTGDPASARAAAAILTALAEIAELATLDDPGPKRATDLLPVLESLEVAAVSGAEEEAVLIAEPLQIRARRFRQVFVTGLCEGEFPGSLTASDPFLDDQRRWEIAGAASLRIAQLEDPLQRERYLLYACVSRATQRVCISYRSCDEEGKLELPSPFIDDILALFTDELYADRIRRPLSDVTWAPGAAPTPHERELALAAADGDRRQERDPTLAPATYTLAAAAREHLRGAEVVGAGALVQFARCPLRWLVERQLSAQDLDPEADPLARGTFMHALLEQTFRSLGGALTEANLSQALAKLREFALEGEHQLAPGQDEAVREAIRAGVVAQLERVLRFIAKHAQGWTPAHFETAFGAVGADERRLPALELSAGGRQIRVSGTIDRIDVDPARPAQAIVRDYKSGRKRPEWAGNRWLQDGEIQVALYMLAAERLLGLQPRAGLYQPLTDADLRARGTFDSSLPASGELMKEDAVEPQALAARLKAVEELAVELGCALREGELTPAPQRCSRDGCRYPWICWAS